MPSGNGHSRRAKTMVTANLWSSAASVKKCVAAKASFVALNQVDLALTLLAVYLGFSEHNPIIANLYRNSVLQLLLVKTIVPAFIAWLSPGKLLLPAIAFLAMVVGWDIKELLRFFLFH